MGQFSKLMQLRRKTQQKIIINKPQPPQNMLNLTQLSASVRIEEWLPRKDQITNCATFSKLPEGFLLKFSKEDKRN